jgi:hypothetical protein
MKVAEFIKANKTVLRVIMECGVCPSDVQYISLYDEYMRMKEEGHKLMYIVAFLCDEYGVSEATVYRVLKRFGREL